MSQRASEEKGGHSCLSGRGREWGSWGRRCREGRTKTERTGRPTAGRGGKGRRRSCRRAGAEGVSERSGRAREGREGGSRGGARAHWERARRRVELDRVCCQRRDLRLPFYHSSTRTDTGSSQHAFPATRPGRTGFLGPSFSGRSLETWLQNMLMEMVLKSPGILLQQLSIQKIFRHCLMLVYHRKLLKN